MSVVIHIVLRFTAFIAMLALAALPATAQFTRCDTTLAPERWSEPVRLPDRVNIRYGVKYYPTLMHDGKTLLYYSTEPSQEIMQTTMNDTGWTTPEVFPLTKGFFLVKGTYMSPDNKLFFFCVYGFGGWVLLQRRWDEEKQLWGPATYPMIKLGESGKLSMGYDQDSIQIGAVTARLSNDGAKLYFASDGEWDCNGLRSTFCGKDIFVVDWNPDDSVQGERCCLPINVNYSVICEGRGLCSEDESPVFTGDGKKMYFSKKLMVPYNNELCVSYLDSTGEWGKAMRLNINSYADTNDQVNGIWGGTTTGFDYHPAITPDGRTMIFASRRNTMIYDWPAELYISHLVVDENGDSVATSINEFIQPVASELQLSAYPNPFTYSTAIRLHINRTDDIQIRVYSIYGGLIATIHEGRLTSGQHTFNWNGYSKEGIRVPKGMYFIHGSTSEGAVVRTVVYL